MIKAFYFGELYSKFSEDEVTKNNKSKIWNQYWMCMYFL